MTTLELERERLTIARTAYDDISSLYETASAEHAEHNRKVLAKVVKLLPAHSNILDVGSGTGKPVAAFFADHGHSVTGVDFSDGMLERARSQVPSAKFIKGEMTTFVPPSPGEYDLVVASQSLYNLSVFQIRHMILKFSRWLKKGGILLIGSSSPPNILQELKLDRHGWMEGFSGEFMEHTFIGLTVAQADSWLEVLKEMGMEILDVDKEVCMLKVGDEETEEHQFFITSRRTVENPLHGPFPIPKEEEHKQHALSNHRPTWEEVERRLQKRGDVDAIADTLKKLGCKKVLAIGEGANNLSKLLEGSCEIATVLELRVTDRAHLESFPFPSGHFDAVALVYAMHHAFTGDPKVLIEESLRVLNDLPNATIIVDQAAPDNELTHLAQRVAEDIEGFDGVHQQHGVYLNHAEKLLQKAGFNFFSYETADVILDFSDLPVDQRVSHAAAVLSGLWFSEEYKKQAETKFWEALKIQFLYRPGQILAHSAIMIARKSA